MDDVKDVGDGELERKLRSVVRQIEGIAFAYLFGSVVKGSMRPDSDVDVAIHLQAYGSDGGREPGLAADRRTAAERVEIAERAQALEARLQKGIDRPVQVVALELAPNDLVHNVLRHGRLLVCRDEHLRSRFWVAHARRHFELATARRIFDRYRARRIEKGTFGGRSDDGS